MCGIVGAVAERNIVPILMDGLKQLEYRGYDSAGLAVLNPTSHQIDRVRVQGKVSNLVNALDTHPLLATTGIAHTRWATHGEPCERNAHPHFSHQNVAVVHNGIIENHQPLREELQSHGYLFETDTDTEVVCHLIHFHLQQHNDHRKAIWHTLDKLHGAYALGILFDDQPDTLFAIRHGSPLVVGIGIGEHFIASDQMALLSVTQQFVTLEEDELVILNRTSYQIENSDQQPIERQPKQSSIDSRSTSKGNYRHYMLKEIHEQPSAITDTLSGFVFSDTMPDNCFGHRAEKILPSIKRVVISACGTSYHAGLVAKQWLESLAKIPCHVEVASEYRYRDIVPEPNTLFVALSQSGETADTLAALRKASTMSEVQATLAICNVGHSSLVQEADLTFITQAGIEIGVAATKTFTAQLTALLMLTIALGKHHGLTHEQQTAVLAELKKLPALVQQTIELDKPISKLAQTLADKQQMLYLGRNAFYAIALEGALKLKEISYMHAEAYPAGELKHGPLALVDNELPVIVLAPNNALIDKLSSNMKEVEARGGQLIVFSDETNQWQGHEQATIVDLPACPPTIAPIVFTIPLQLLAYHVAVLKGTDVDQPRNLAKSVTVE